MSNPHNDFEVCFIDWPSRRLTEKEAVQYIIDKYALSNTSDANKPLIHPDVIFYITKMPHSCDPNFTIVFDGVYTHMQSLKTIEKGKILTISFIDENQNKEMRQKQLFERWGFVCQCKKCMNE